MGTPISTYQVYLMQGTGTDTITYSNLVPVKDFPDLVSVPEPIETTTLSDGARTYIPGIRNDEQKTFTCNYNKDDYATLKALEGSVKHWAVWFGANSSGQPDGHDGKFAAEGYLNVSVNGGGVNEPVDMTVTLTLTKGFEYVSAA